MKNNLILIALSINLLFISISALIFKSFSAVDLFICTCLYTVIFELLLND